MSASNTAGDSNVNTVTHEPPRVRWRWSEDTGLIIVFVLMILAIGIPHPEFFSFGSIRTILRQSALVGIIAFGMVYLVAMVEIDLSVGGIFAVAGSFTALLIKFYHVDPWVAVALALMSGIVLGGLNGVLTSLLKVPLIIVSLGTLSAYFGLHLILSDGKAIYGLPKEHAFFRLFGGDLFQLPASVWTAIVCAIVLYFVFVHTRFGATVRAIGSNPAAAEFIGVRTGLIRIYATALVGLLSVVTCRHDGLNCAMTATSVSALSMEPPSMLICVNRSAAFHRALNSANEFAINILSRAHVDISRLCSGGANPESRFEIGCWDTRAAAPVLVDAQAAIVCLKDKELEYGTHTVFMGRIVSLAVNGDIDPLIYVDGKYAGRAALTVP